MINLQDIKQAHSRIAPYILESPVIRMPGLDGYLGCEVYIKAECLQITGAFKLRGAMNALLQLTDEQRRAGVVAASSGNHGKALSYGAGVIGTGATIVIPDTTPSVKVKAIEQAGGQVVMSTTVERFKVAQELAEAKGGKLVHPYNDETVMCGQGTMGLEICRQLPEVDTIVVPVSGGGMLSGLATAVKESHPRIRVIGAEPQALPRYTISLAKGEPTAVRQQSTIADALVSNRPGELCFPVVQRYVDDMVTVPDEMMMQGTKLLLTEGRVLAEFSAAIGIGAVIAGRLSVQRKEKVCFVVSGGSIGWEQLRQLDEISLPQRC